MSAADKVLTREELAAIRQRCEAATHEQYPWSAIIAAARTDIPRLLAHAEAQDAEVDRLRTENAKLREALGEQLSHDAQVEKGARLYFGLPIKEMIDRGWIRADDVDDSRVGPELARFFQVPTVADVLALLAKEATDGR